MYVSGMSTPAIQDALGINNSTVGRILKRRGIAVRPLTETSRRFHVQEDFFDVIDSERKAYWLGMLAADGSVSGNVVNLSLQCGDVAHVERFRADIGSSHPIKTNVGQKLLAFRCKHMISALAEHGIVPRKSWTYSPRLQLIPPHLHRHFWRGMVDGDGWITVGKTGQRMLGLCGTEMVVSLFKSFMEGQGAVARIWRQPESVWCSAVSNRDGFAKISTVLYADCEVFLARKAARIDALMAEAE